MGREGERLAEGESYKSVGALLLKQTKTGLVDLLRGKGGLPAIGSFLGSRAAVGAEHRMAVIAEALWFHLFNSCWSEPNAGSSALTGGKTESGHFCVLIKQSAVYAWKLSFLSHCRVLLSAVSHVTGFCHLL